MRDCITDLTILYTLLHPDPTRIVETFKITSFAVYILTEIQKIIGGWDKYGFRPLQRISMKVSNSHVGRFDIPLKIFLLMAAAARAELERPYFETRKRIKLWDSYRFVLNDAGWGRSQGRNCCYVRFWSIRECKASLAKHSRIPHQCQWWYCTNTIVSRTGWWRCCFKDIQRSEHFQPVSRYGKLRRGRALFHQIEGLRVGKSV